MTISETLMVASLIISTAQEYASSRSRILNLDVGETESFSIGQDIKSGCMCREIPRRYAFCFGRDTCHSFPGDIHITTNSFLLKASQISQIIPGDLMGMTHLETLKIEGNYNFTRILPGSFVNMSNLKTLSVSYNARLEILEKKCFDGLVNLTTLYLVQNAFVQLSNVINALIKLPLIKLVLNENKFSVIRQIDFKGLQNSSLKELNLILCQIDDIEPKAFNSLTNLTALRLGENNFNATVITNVVEDMIFHVPLQLLNLHSVGLKKDNAKQLLTAIAKSNITHLRLARNQFEIIDSKMFPQMPKLEFLDLREVLALNITNNAFVGLSNLKSLLLSGNKLTSIPEGALLEQLTFLDLQQNSGDRYFSVYGKKFINMKNLEHLDLSFNAIHALYNSSFLGLENLRVLGLKNATIYRIYNGTFVMLSKLVFLNLENNFFLKYHPYSLEEGILNGLKELEVLLLGGCEIKFISRNLNPFRDLGKLNHLDLKNNQLKTLPNFGILPKLKSIDLSSNTLQPWQEPVFKENLYLRDVRMNNNKFTYLSDIMIQDLENLGILELRNNPFTCDCSFSWNNRKIMALIDKQNIFCFFPDTTSNLTIPKFLQKKTSCLNWTLFISLAAIAFCIGSIIFCIIYFRSHLRYWLFIMRLHLGRNRKLKRSLENSAYTNYIYDAFVSYSSEDRNFVIRLVTMLENYPPFIKLCVYERDFEVGTMISENVLESVAKSRKTLLVISNSYAKSQWCRWESQIAENHRLFLQNDDGEYCDDSVVLIKLGPINETYMTPTLRYLLKTRIYLQWDVDEKKQKLFWQKLRTALTPPEEISVNTHL